MHKYLDYTRERLRQLADRMRHKIYPETRPIGQLLVSGPVDRIAYADAMKLKGYRPARVGEQFGPLWATFWFKAKAAVPKEWKGRRVDLLWGMHSESTLWVNGRIMQGLNWEPMSWDGITRPDAVLAEKARGGETLGFEIEMACNKLFGYDGNHAPHLRSISPYVLDYADIALFDQEAWDLYFDFSTLQQLDAEHHRLDQTWAGKLVSELNRFANTYDIDDRATWPRSRRILRELYRHTNPDCTHELSAIGHAHIDTAWLWPLAETQRKCERTFSSQLAYMDAYPDFRFACSQAQQFAWIKERNPDFYKRIAAKVKAGQFIPVGGTWVEPDCNIPSGESLARQFLYGQRFFRKEFGITCTEFWNPDVFGYNGQLPQICRLGGTARFLTQKLSWNRFNKPPHHTFLWEGIDGSTVYTHFPPTDNYNSMARVQELVEGPHRYKDNERSSCSILLFGIGDGGGGPTKKMIETLRRAEDLQGIPRTKMRSAREFFDMLEADCPEPLRVVGELYFEYHRGTYTTQAATKRGNRKCEFHLHDLEFLATMAHELAPKYRYPAADIERLWKKLLTNQFHDILPGSSIRLVYEDAERHYGEIAAECAGLAKQAIGAVTRGETKKAAGKPARHETVVINTTGFPRAEVVDGPHGKPIYVEAPPYGIGQVHAAPDSVQITASGKSRIVVENRHLRAVLSADGSVASLIDKASGREALAAPGNRLFLYEDQPTAWDAWDVDPFHMEKETPCAAAESFEVIEQSPLRCSVEFTRPVGKKSRMRQVARLAADSRRLEFVTEVDWQESHLMLKVAFPVNVRAMNATYEMQFGCVERPTHFNTSHDLARYEVPGHKWSDLSEHGFGVALLSESKYGFSTHDNVMRMSLLRSTKHPDPEADMGLHRFVYAVMPHAGGWREAGVVAEAYRFNVPVIVPPASECGNALAHGVSFLSADDPNIVIDTVKRAEDGGAVIVRMYECHGARGTARVRWNMPMQSARFCNILEEDLGPAKSRGGVIEVPYEPFKVIGLKIVP